MRLPPLPRRARRAIAAGLAAAVALYLAALAAASTEGVEALLRDRIQTALRARLGPVEVGDEVHVDPLFRVRFGPLVLPLPRSPGARAGAGAEDLPLPRSAGERAGVRGTAPAPEPLLHVDRVTVRASLPALLSGRLEPASIRLTGVRLRPGEGSRDLRALARRLEGGRGTGAATSAAGGELPTLRVRGLVVSMPLAGEDVDLGPVDADVRVAREGPDRAVRLDARLPGGGRVRLDATRSGTGWRAALTAEHLVPSLLPAPLRDGSVAPAEGEAALLVEAEAPADLSRVEGRFRAEVSGAVVTGERVGPEPVGPLGATGAAGFAWDRGARRLSVRDGAGTLLGAVPVRFEAALELGSPAAFSVALRAEDVDWRAALAALPPVLAPPPDAPRPPGTVDARLEASGPIHAPGQWQVRASLDLSRLREAAREAGAAPLSGAFEHRPPLDGGDRGPELRIGAPSPDFVPISDLAEPVLRAVTAAEDGGFFGHPGFDFDELRNAVAQGAERGRVVRGGSTITQQVAKNLYLGPERTLARKVREAAITVGLEATLTKRRILEVYLNIAEWGPGVWGIGPAARLWFGKDARALTVKEAAFLASIIAYPTRAAHQMLARGAPTDEGLARAEEVLVRMGEQRAIPGDVLSQALEEPLVFAPQAISSTSPPQPGPLPRGAGERESPL